MRSRTRRFFVTLLIAMAIPVGRAERPVPLDTQFIRDHVETRGFRSGRPVSITVAPDGNSVFFLRAGPRSAKQALYEFTLATGETRELLTGEALARGGEESLSNEERARRERMRVSAGGLTSYQVSADGTQLLLPFGGKLYLYTRTTGRVTELPLRGVMVDPMFSPTGRQIAFVRDHDLWVYEIRSARERRVTQGGTELVENGVAEFVAQEEMSRFHGYWWSPDAKELIYQQNDASGVEVWHVPDPLKPGTPPVPQFYPRPGKSNVVVRVGIVPVKGGKTRWVQWDATRYPYLTHVDWHKTGGLTMSVQTRDQRSLKLLRIDPASGKTRELLEETDPAWVNLDQDVPRWLGDGSGFLWTTERSGGWELELRDPAGVKVRTLVGKDAGFRGLKRVDELAKEVWFRASVNPTETQVWRVPLLGGSASLVSGLPGNSDVELGGKPMAYALTHTGPETLAVTRVYRADGTLTGTLPSVAEEPGLTARTEIVRVDEGPGFYARITRPRNFEGNRKYPVLVDIYGGPHANTVDNALGGWLMPQWLADQGFVVISADNRGTPRRGREWERSIYGRFASVPVEDQVRVLQALGRRYSELDLGRVGITGWSFGGYMSALAVLRRPDVFHAGVAGAPVTDWLDYDTHYTERYLGVPGEGDTVYKENSLLADAAGLKRPLLLIHGTADDNVFFRHSLRLADGLTRAGKPFEFLPLAGFTHMVPEPAMAEQRWTRTVDFFRRNLPK